MANKKFISDSLKIFKKCVFAVQPEELIRRNVKYDSTLNILTVSGETFDLNKKNVHLVGAGKAVQSMALEMEKLLGANIKSGIISVPRGSLRDGTSVGRVQYYEGAENNLPDVEAEATSIKIKDLVSGLRSDDILIVLISGGGSALLTLPSAPIALGDKCALVKRLANAGADIREVNTVRKKLSELKGGRLARLAQPARVVSLILSDVVGDPLDLIASGPTVRDPDRPLDAKRVIDRYNLFETLPVSIQTALLQDEGAPEYPHDNVSNYIIGSNRLSLRAGLREAAALGYPAVVVSSDVVGNVLDVARQYVALAECLCDLHNGRISSSEAEEIIKAFTFVKNSESLMLDLNAVISESELCLILGGEPTVAVRGAGRGGRSQHLALELSRLLHEAGRGAGLVALCAGTDGADGPTDAAGAVACAGLAAAAARAGLDVARHLRDHDSYTFYSSFEAGRLHVKTGHTHTNVMDVHVLMLSFHDS